MKQFIDSASLAIPLKHVKILDKELITKLALSKDQCYSQTVSVMDEDIYHLDTNPRIKPDVKTPLGVNAYGEVLGYVYYKIKNKRFPNNRSFLPCIDLTINSKMLKQDYYQGITLKTVKRLYDFIISQEIISLTFESFLNGIITDVDIAQDCYQEIDLVKLSKDAKQTVKPEYKTFFKTFFHGKTGFRCGSRQSNSIPEFKIYDKQADMLSPTGQPQDVNQKLAFTEQYLSTAQHPFARFEVTFPTKSDMFDMSLIIKGQHNTLIFILEKIDKQQGRIAMSKRAKQYFETTVMINNEFDITQIKGTLPPKSVIAKLYKHSQKTNTAQLSISMVIDLALTFLRPNNHKWAKSYLTQMHYTNAQHHDSDFMKTLDTLSKTDKG